MNPLRVILGVLLRAAGFVAVTVVAVVAFGFADSDDALGAGLLAFLVMATIAFGWALVDGIRHGFLLTLITWALVSVIAGVAIPGTFAVAGSGVSVAEIADGAVFFGFLLGVPAAIGLCLGGLVHRLRSRPRVAA